MKLKINHWNVLYKSNKLNFPHHIEMKNLQENGTRLQLHQNPCPVIKRDEQKEIQKGQTTKPKESFL